MIEAFFQERFNKNIKFYENKTEIELQRNYEHLYNDIELKDIFLAELKIIKKLIINEKETKNNSPINFDDYIKVIDELYNQIEKMNASEIQQQQNNIELIITASKLSLNSPTYFKVDIEKLKKIDLNRELNSFISNAKQNNRVNNDALKQFKNLLIQEMTKKRNLIETKKTEFRNPEILDKFEDLYWKLNDSQIDAYAFMAGAFQLDFTQDEKKVILDITQKRIHFGDKKSLDSFNYRISALVTDFKQSNNSIKTEISDIENRIDAIKKIFENIDDNGFLIQGISNNLVDEYINLISSLNLDVVSVTHEIIKEQNRILTNQKIDEIVKLIEKKVETLPRPVKTEEKKPEPEIQTKYDELLDTANKILNLVKNSGYNLKLDELESIFVEDLKNNQIDEKKIEEIMDSASSEACRLKFIVYGLKYQLENIDQNNIDKSMNLIALYINKFGSCFEKLNNEKKIKQEKTKQNDGLTFDEKISEMKTEILKIDSQIDEDFLKQFDDEKIKNLELYSNVDFENMSEHDKKKLDYALEQTDINYATLSLYKSYITLKKQISETKIFIDLINEEKTIDFLSQAEEKIKLVVNLLKQYIEAKRIYEEKQLNDTESNDIINDNQNIVVYFETDDGTTQIEERISEDTKIYGKYKPSELKNIEYLINLLKKGTKNEIEEKSKPIVQTRLKDNKSYNATYGRRISTSGTTRVAYKQIPSSVLNTDKAVYLVISGGKKISNNSAVYDDAINLSDKVNNFIDEYERLTTEQEKHDFIEHQQQTEKRIMKLIENGRGEKDATIRR